MAGVSSSNRPSNLHRTGPPLASGFSTTSPPRSSQDQAPLKPYYVTTPIFYVNADPHIGHLHSCLVADVLARWHNLRRAGYSQLDHQGLPLPESSIESRIAAAPPGRSVLSTGTDEHGLKIQKVAEALGQDPKQVCDRVSGRFKELADAGNVDYHRFIRTTEPSHVDAVSHLWRLLKSKDLIYKGSHEGWYAVSDEAFYPDTQVREVVDEKTGERHMESIETGARVEWSSEENYKFRLSAFQDDLVRWLETDPNAIQPARRHSEVLNEIRTGLTDLSISRPSSRLSWGIPVPGDPEHSIYVWVDALTNYLTVTGYPWSEPPSDERPSCPRAWPADVHVVGKDIIRFHAIYWPAFLLGAGLPLPKTILAHSHWTMNKSKMSKSRGNVANPFDAIKLFGLDAIRFFLMRVGGNFATDSDYSPAVLLEFHRKYLQGQLGNLASRISAPKIHARLARFTKAGSSEVERLPEDQVSALLDQETRTMVQALEQALTELPSKVDDMMARFEFSKALEAILEGTIGQTNELLQRMEPWSASVPEEVVLEAVVLVSESLRICGTLLRPFMPNKMDELLDVLQVDANRRQRWADLVAVDGPGRLRASIQVRPADAPKVKPLFPRLEVDAA
ncbi:probable METHIONYL-TRNA SYNTHETASE, mitochondrial [Pseudozyma flocculosa]|uniref:Probable methionine--tRNA ligase, mitochondrial n=1 Tax=Pseudozyma flocculosa TaxID=84751 RepID=A0A5C3ERS5_9BASI|nr:probable METHIONYL-TRNA SYNTHETASE, mitochondrial [Pseudozyma flocculosa]